VIASAAPICTADEHIVGAVGVFQDYQPFKEVKVLREIDRLKSEFIANVSHELRTPLHHIKGYATTLLRPQIHFDAQTMHDYLRTIVDESDKLERLIADLLDTSCIETGTLTLDIESARIAGKPSAHIVLKRYSPPTCHLYLPMCAVSSKFWITCL
jgi:K+-sensing histidine kinase KdpD